jgi:DNA-binding beta-propeller fold protein YncE
MFKDIDFKGRFSDETSATLPASTGSTAIDTDGQYMYIGGMGAPYQIYKISIADHSTTYAQIDDFIFRLRVAGDYIWGVGLNVVQKINKHTLAVEWSNTGTIAEGRSMAFDGTHIWCADMGGAPSRLHKINPETNSITSYPDILPSFVRRMCFDGTYLWATCSGIDTVVRINPVDLSHTEISGLTGAWGVCYAGSYISGNTEAWGIPSDHTGFIIVAGAVQFTTTGYIYKIDPATATVLDSNTITLAGNVWLCDAAYDGRYIWCADNDRNVIRIIDPENLAFIDERATPGMRPHMAVFDGKYIWVVSQGSSQVAKFSY